MSHYLVFTLLDPDKHHPNGVLLGHLFSCNIPMEAASSACRLLSRGDDPDKFPYWEIRWVQSLTKFVGHEADTMYLRSKAGRAEMQPMIQDRVTKGDFIAAGGWNAPNINWDTYFRTQEDKLSRRHQRLGTKVSLPDPKDVSKKDTPKDAPKRPADPTVTIHVRWDK